ncbi:transporter [Microtetraspora sp. NBRC 13810]|uniref:hypothetical protein n=1 Tax=Microtetraspora sp. NBRC 13810 TaxID=3030990 RepID=UPI0024A482D1|nr:hypothetical protein [Microtetraspora sp. NBRC 13810]GLW05434.1 transporter [Microtetraspora sp. NBRC 13810]
MAGVHSGVSAAPPAAAPLGLGRTVGLFVRLKLRLIAGNLRGELTYRIGFLFTLLAAAAVAVIGFLAMSLLRLVPAGIAVDLGIVAFALVFLGWAVLPLLAFGLDDTLDPARLSLLPLRTRQLAAGLFVTSAIGPWPFASLVVTSGAIIGLAAGAGGALLGMLAVLLQFALCLVVSRLITTSLSRVLRTRRGRDLLAVAAIFVVVLAQLPNLVINRGLSGDWAGMLADTAAVLRWTPPGMAAHAMADGGPAALAELALLAVLALLLGLLWIEVLRRALVTADASTQAGGVRRSRGGVARLLPDGQLAAVVTKELKYARREPRGRVGWFASVAVTAVLGFSLSGQSDEWAGVEGAAALVVVPAGLGALMIGLQSCNAFGIDGRSLWMNSVVYGSERELRTDLAGRHLAVSLIACPLLAVLSIIAALLAGNLLWSLPATLTAWGVLGLALGVGAVTSVIFPYTTPDRLNAFTGAVPGQGGVAFLGSFAAIIGTSVLVAPIVVPVLFSLPWLSVAAVPYGLVVAWGGRRLAALIGFARFPELLAAVSRSA